MRKLPKPLPLLVGIVAVAILGGVWYALNAAGTESGTAYFDEAKNIYPGDQIRILGVEVGKVDKVKTIGPRVRIDFHYDRKYALPANVKAAIMSPTLVSTRFIQLDPPYTGGPVLPDGGVIPESRTVVPVEFDELKSSLMQLSDALGPHGVNQTGALNRALATINANGRPNGVGQGQNFQEMIRSLSRAAQTLSDGRQDLFGTVRNLAVFSSGLNRVDTQIVEFDDRLDEVSGILDDNSRQLHELLPTIDDAGHEVDKFLRAHAGQLSTTVDRAGSLSRAIAQERGNLAQLLHIAPNTLTNFLNIMNPRTGDITAALSANFVLSNLGGPGDSICSLMTAAAAADEAAGQQMCVKYLGPVFKHLAMETPPVGVYAVQVPSGVTPSYGDLQERAHQKDTNTTPGGTNSDLPRSTTANGDRGPAGPGGLIGLMRGGQ